MAEPAPPGGNMLSVPITESMLAITLAVGFLAAAVFAIVCYRPFGVRGDPLDSFLVVAALALIGVSGGFGVACLARKGYGEMGRYAPAFLICICCALVFTAVFLFRRRAQKQSAAKEVPNEEE